MKKKIDLSRLVRNPNLVALPIVLVVAIAVALVTGLGLVALQNANDYAIEKQGDLLVRALGSRAEQVAREVIPQVFWQEAAEKVRARDLDWMDENYGEYLHNVYGYRQSFVLDGRDQPIYAAIDHQRVSPEAFADVAPRVARWIAEIRDFQPGDESRKAGLLAKAETFADGSALWLVMIARPALVDGRPSLVAVTTILPDTDPAGLGGEPPYLLVAVADIDDAVLGKIARDQGYAELKWGDDRSGGRVVRNLPDDRGASIGFLSWIPERPALAFVRQLAPVLGVSLAILVLTSLAAMFAVRSLAGARAAAGEARLMASASQTALDAVVVADRRGRIIEFNHAAEASFGYPRAAMIGSDLAARLIAEPHRERFLHGGLERMIGTRSEAEGIRADGRPFPIEISIGNSSSSDGPVTIAFIRDITERLENERKLNEAVQRAEVSNKAKERFLAVMSHEIRTPLNGVLGVLELLRNTPLTPEQRELARTARQSGDALLALISDILDLSKMEHSAIELRPTRIWLGDLVASAVRITAHASKANRNRVTSDIDAAVPPYILADEVRLRQVLINLLSNAQKFTREGTIEVSVRQVRGSDGAPQLEFTVVDSGQGIDPARVGELFKDFSRLDPGLDRRTEGTGLGLAICKRIVSAMGGEVGADGRPGKGSRFWFRIPLQPAEPPVAQPAAPEPGALTLIAPDGRSYRILVAEDNPTNLLVTRGMLEAGGHSVVAAANGLEAVAAATAQPFDLILMDLSMPELDGLEATRQIRELPPPAGTIPIIALSAHAMSEDREHALAAGATSYLVKPIRQAELLSRIASILSQQAEAPLSAAADEPACTEPDGAAFDTAFFDGLRAELPGGAAESILRHYEGDQAATLSRLRTAAGERDGGSFARGCHALAGSASAVGAARVAALARELEAMCRGGEADAAMAALPRLEAAAVAAIRAITAELAATA